MHHHERDTVMTALELDRRGMALVVDADLDLRRDLRLRRGLVAQHEVAVVRARRRREHVALVLRERDLHAGDWLARGIAHEALYDGLVGADWLRRVWGGAALGGEGGRRRLVFGDPGIQRA